MKLIYIASPYRGDIKKNTAFAKDCCIYAINEGVNVYCPHLFLPNFLSEDVKEERETALAMGKEMILRCDEVWVFGESITEGMFSEIEFAKENGTHIKRVMDIYQVKTHTNGQCLC